MLVVNLSGIIQQRCQGQIYGAAQHIGGKAVGMAKSVDRKVEGKTVHADGLCLSH